MFSGGLGITGGIKRGDLLYTEPSTGWFNIADGRRFEKDQFISPSIPLEIDLLFKPIKFLGVGFSLFGDLNFNRPMYGVALKLGIGQLRL
jgi:hypothetical protein